MHRILITAALAWLPASGASAQQIHKCVAADGGVSYQSAPCGEGQQPARTWDHGQYAPPAPMQLPAARDSRSARETGRRGYATASRRIGTSTAADDRCEAARRHRDSVLRNERVGQRSIELRRRLDQLVADACGK
ncbi:DUF4124 domain-containing protein [Pseudoxanthomonas sp. SGNA-20]|uniref:DUF4124 domain-containing protein n=1 Tax=unclassified Pseudoxanthomonas TaxID=2645906 RepID=UPI000310D70E|nr:MULTISPECIES: DUF4124 domain-containing protein [unclassified Pseudoxanthomonas]RRN55364.1 DUF4124 domain-containing protein [Pseudoxanthomonas sp. SGNA-20]RRN78563.1 DUF4124 domain-containing protein [Pseudoxanthomonas sp. SGD-10]